MGGLQPSAPERFHQLQQERRWHPRLMSVLTQVDAAPFA